MKFILGKKVKMTQIWREDKLIPCTMIQAGPCFITQIKNEGTDDYSAVQISYGTRKPKNISKPVKGHLKKALGRDDVRYLREFRVDVSNEDLKMGKMIDVSSFKIGDVIDVVATSKGKGFQGVVRRHGFSGTKKTHGNKDQLRASGSVGATGPAHVFKGTRMGGRMGGDRVTTKNLEVIEVDLENNSLLVKGAVPGSTNGLVMIKGNGELELKDKEVEKKEVKSEKEIKEELKEEVKEEAKEEAKEELKDEVKEEVKEEIKEEAKEEAKEEVKEEKKEEPKKVSKKEEK